MTVKSHLAGRDAAVIATYQRLIEVASGFGPVTQRPNQSSIHLVNHTTFAGVHTRQSWLIVTLKSANDIRSPRITKREQASTNRWHLELRLDDPAQIDRQLTAWLKTAYELAGANKGRERP